MTKKKSQSHGRRQVLRAAGVAQAEIERLKGALEEIAAEKRFGTLHATNIARAALNGAEAGSRNSDPLISPQNWLRPLLRKVKSSMGTSAMSTKRPHTTRKRPPI